MEDSIIKTLDNKNHLFSHAEESGTVSIKLITSVGLVFENAPVCILGLFPIKVDKIYIPQFFSSSYLLRHIESKGIDSQLYNKYVSLVGRKCFIFGKNKVSVAYWLILGSTQFLNDQLDTLQNKNCLYVLDHHKTLRRLPTFMITLRRLTHAQCGGATLFHVIIGYNFPFQVITLSLRQKTGDFIDHSILTRDMKILPSDYISAESLYPISHIER